LAQEAFVFPASFAQKRLWFLDRLAPEHAFYNMPAAVRLGEVDAARLRLAFDGLVARHESLRTCFAEVDGQAVQLVLPRAALPFEEIDLSDATDAEGETERIVRDASARPFDLATAPLLRVTLLRRSAREHVLLLVAHHIIADGWSFEVLFGELTSLYEASAPLAPLPLQYADYALWQHRRAAYDAEREYWRRQLEGLPDVLTLPADHPRPAEQRFHGRSVPLSIATPTLQALRRLAKETDATLFMVLLTAFQTLLHRYSGVADLAVGSPVAGRHHDDLGGTIGLFVNTVVLRTRFDGNPTVSALIARVRETVLGAYAHQELPFEQLVAELAPRRTLRHQPLVQVLFGLQTVGGDGARRLPVDIGTAKCDLTLSLTESDEAVSGVLEYDADLFEPETIERMRGHFDVLVNAMAADRDARVGELPLLTDEELRRQLHEWNRTAAPFPSDVAVHRLVEARVAAAPGSIAVIDGAQSLTYGELNARADRLAQALAARGVRRGDRVGICLPRSAEMIVAWLAALKAGAAYVPLDPDYPAERLAYLVSDADLRVVIDESWRTGNPACLDSEQNAVSPPTEGKPTGRPPAGRHGRQDRQDCLSSTDVSGDDIAYLVYTSGSTGVPKGVAIPHRGITSLVVNTNYIDITAADCFSQISSASFDAATFEVWGALIHGARISIVPRDVALEPGALLEQLRRDGVTVLFLTTSLFNQLADAMPGAFASLRCLFTGGEMADPARFRNVLRHGKPRHFVNVYGPSEATTYATFHPVDDVPETATSILIGSPIANTTTYIVDARMQPVPVGVPGELLIGGDGLAAGYHARPALTAEKFVPNPWGAGRLYRTGDLVRARADGAIEILGRLDDQVKIRGFRVEPGEVEALLLQHPSVRDAVVAAREIGREKRLIAYVVTHDEVAEPALRAWLRERIPEHMVPAAVVRLDRLPLNTNGKVDRAALPEVRTRGSEEESAPPRTRAERELVEIWCEVLGLDGVGIHDNFFELGGDSILSIQVISRATPRGLRFTPRQLFQHQTIAELAPFAGSAAVAEAEQGLIEGEVPLTPIQRWFFDQELADAHHFNQAITLEWPAGLGEERLEERLNEAIRRLLRHHDALRMRFEGRRQWIAPPGDDAVLTNAAPGEVQRSLDLANGPLIRFARCGDRLLIAAHHLVVDMVSWRILTEDLAALLRGRELPPKTTSFKAYAERLQSRPEPEREETDGARLPVDRPYDPAENSVATARVVTVSLDAAETRALLHGDTSALLLEALQHALESWSGARGLAVDVETHGRDVLGDEVDLTRTVGWFTRIVPAGRGRAQISFNYLGQFAGDGREPGDGDPLTGGTRSPRGRRRYLIEVDGGVVGGRLRMHWTYSEAVHERATIERVARAFIDALRRRDDAYPLSPLQEGMLFHGLYAPRSGQYVVQMATTLSATLDVERFREAWERVVNRHEILRSAFVWDGVPRPQQVIAAHARPPWDIRDWRGLSNEELEAFLDRDRAEGFDFGRAPLMRFALLRVDDATWRFVWTCHHLLIDGWSRPLILDEVADAYEGVSTVPVRRPYRDYIQWLQRQDAARAEQFWRETLAGFSTPTPIVETLPRTDRDGFASTRRLLSQPLTATLESAARRARVTLSTVVHAAWALLLARSCGAADVVFGSVVSGRPADLDGVEQMIGPFINTLPVRVAVADDTIAAVWLRELQDRLARAREFEYSALVDVQRWSAVPAGVPLFQSLLVFENYPSTASSAATPAGETRFVDWTNYPLTVTAIPGARLALEISYSRRIADTAAARLLAHLERIVERIVEGLDAPLRTLSLLTGEERHRLAVEWNETDVDFPAATVPRLLASRASDAPALFCGNDALTFAAMLERARAIAARVREHAPGRIGVFLPRSIDLPVALLAILDSGCAYVPLDIAGPAERIAWQLRDAAVRAVITTRALAPRLSGVEVIAIEDVPHAWPPGDAPAPRPEDAAYVVYTSGTTGEPKGVVVPHRALTNHALALASRYGLGPADRVLHLAAVSFDVAAEELFPTWIAGGAVVAWPSPHAPSIAELVRFIEEWQLTVLNLPTPLWHAWVDDLADGASRVPSCVRSVIVGTDRVDPERLRVWRARIGDRVQWHNAYGCAETTITSSVFSLRPGEASSLDPVPIGRPVANTRLYVVDARMELTPAGVPGELVIAGEGIALGYLDRPELTAQKFVGERWRANGGRAYRTGDLVRWRDDGQLEFLGRLDDQVKIRGIRVEPAELEAWIARHPAVRDAVVVARDPGKEAMHEKQLVAYVVGSVDESPLRAWLAERVPEYLLPAAIVRMERLPLSANGKVDRAALPAPRPRGGGDSTAPRTESEEMLAAIWCDVLGLETVGIHDSFFELGGHSLTAMRIVSRVRRAAGVELPLRALFETPTIAALAGRIDAGAARATPSIPRRTSAGPCALSFAQERLWFLEQLDLGSPRYNMPCSLRLAGTIDLGAIQASLDEIVRRHESLRTAFTIVDGTPMQVISPDEHLPLRLIDLQPLPDETRYAEAMRQGAEEVRTPFDLRRGPLVRAAILRLGEREHMLLLTMHHTVSDGWSVGVLLRELELLYEAFSRGRSSPLPELPIQYADYAAWQRQLLGGDVFREQVDYWRARLEGMPHSIDLPADRPRPARQTFRGAQDTLRLPVALTAALRALAEREGVTLFMVILAALQLLLSRLSGQEDVAVGTPVAGRDRAELEPLIGLFLNHLVLRTDVSGDPTFRELLARVREGVLGAFAHQGLPFERLLAELNPPRDPSRTPLFQVFLNFVNAADERLHLPEAVAESFTLAGGRTAGARKREETPADSWSEFDLTFYAGEHDGTLQFVLVYNVDLFSAARMAELLDQLARLLEQCADDPSRRAGHYSLVTREALRVLPDPEAPLDDGWIGAVHELFADQARRHPERLAVAGWSGGLQPGGTREQWTYAELEARSNQLAHHLIAEGAGPGAVVAIHATRSAALVCAVLGVMKSGAAFTILDPAYPLSWRDAILALAQPRMVVHSDALGELPLTRYPVTSPAVPVGPDTPACIGFTSGSTGAPKGIVGRHGPLTHFLPWLAETFGLDERDRYSMLSGLSHDPLQREIFTPLCLGAAVCIPSPDDYESGARLAAWAAREHITVAHLTPALGQLLAQSPDGAPRISALQLAFFVGDVLTRRDVLRLRELAPNVTCINYYGSTETQRAVGWFLAAEPLQYDVIPAGRGIRDVQLLVLNSAAQLCGIGELGEIHLRSPHLAQGYLGLDELTAERFLHHRLYRSGDFGRYLPDGNVAFAGRRDQQVKIRGFRIELAQVEAALARCEGVREAVVLAREDLPGDRRLVAYVVPRGGALQPAALRQFVAERLPAYMVPAHLVVMDALPLTPNGKVDRKALPAPLQSGAAPRAEGSTPLETEVAEVWRDVLRLRHADPGQSFFEAGGHSLLSTQLLARVRARFGVEVTLARFFRAPTIPGLAAAIEEARAGNIAAAARIEIVPRDDYRAVLENGTLVLSPELKSRLLSLMRGANVR
jgi:amino acid adenylation domain-containing protein